MARYVTHCQDLCELHGETRALKIMADPMDDGIGGRRPMDGSANYLAGNIVMLDNLSDFAARPPSTAKSRYGSCISPVNEPQPAVFAVAVTPPTRRWTVRGRRCTNCDPTGRWQDRSQGPDENPVLGSRQ